MKRLVLAAAVAAVSCSAAHAKNACEYFSPTETITQRDCNITDSNQPLMKDPHAKIPDHYSMTVVFPGLWPHVIETVSYTGQWATVLLDGQKAIKYEIDRTEFEVATLDFKTTLHVKLGGWSTENTWRNPNGAENQKRAAAAEQIFQTMLKQQSQQPFFYGSWYTYPAAKNQCKKRNDRVDVITYNKKGLVGWEHECRYSSVKINGNTAHVTMKCAGEGEDYSWSATLTKVTPNKMRVQSGGSTGDVYRCP
jgi:hypothetical protein